MTTAADSSRAQINLVAYLPELLYDAATGTFARDRALVCGLGNGTILEICAADAPAQKYRAANLRIERLPQRAVLPGMINAHSHAFQRVIRGRTEYRSARGGQDSFWTWREMMYAAATRLAPEEIYTAARMAFMEMLLAGITTVGEFHYLHHAANGAGYDDTNELALTVIRAARDVGIRVALLKVAYFRAGFNVAPNPRQRRFIARDVDEYLNDCAALQTAIQKNYPANNVCFGIAPHSVRAVPLKELKIIDEYARANSLPVHLHIAEQRAENAACLAEYGATPVQLLADNELLHERLTGVHGIYVTQDEINSLAQAGSCVCACPTTERNLGDGIAPVDKFMAAGVRVALGTDSHTQIDLLEDARELEYHLRLQHEARNVLLATSEQFTGKHIAEDRNKRQAVEQNSSANIASLAARLFACATREGAQSLGLNSGGRLTINAAADFFTVNLNDATLAGADENSLLPHIVFSAARAAIREVYVGGERIISDGRHATQETVIENFVALQRKLWIE